MKMLVVRISVAVLLTAIAFGCSTERSVNPFPDGPRPINFSAKIDNRTSTRVSGNDWTPGDEIGIFMFASDGESPGSESTSGFDAGESAAKTPLRGNVKHIHGADGYFRAAVSDEALYYPTTGQTVDFAAYYPFSEELTEDNKYKIDVRDQVDLLHSNNARAKLDETAALTFGHVLCRLSLAISAADETPLDGLQVRISGAATHGTLDLASGELTLEDGQEAIAATVETAPDGAVSVNTILLPAEDVDLSIHFEFADGEESVLTLSGKDLARGKDYGYKISVDESARAVVVEGSTIDEWEDVDGGELSVGKGAREEFYKETLGSENYFGGSKQKPLGQFQGWGSGVAGVTYSADSEEIKVRSNADSVNNPFVEFPSGGGTVTISGLPVEEWSSVIFSCLVRVPSGSGELSAGELQFFDGDGGAELTPAELPVVGESWTQVSFSLPADKICIRTAAGLHLDDIALSGLAK